MQWRGKLVVSAAVIAAAVAFAAIPDLPPPFATPSVRNPPRIVPKPAGASLRTPPKFHMEVYAEGFHVPRFMTLGPQGEVLLSDSARAPEGTVYILEGGNRKKLIEGLTRPYGLAFWHEYLYVAEPESVKRYKYDAASKSVGPAEEVVSLAGFTSDHWTRTLLFDREGKNLYVAIGSGSNDSPGEDPRRAAISRYNPDGSGHEIYASGTRNPIGLRWYPGTDTLWASVQERDTFGDDLVQDYLTRVQRGGFYGWPYAYIGPHPDPLNEAKAPAGLIAKAIVPDVVLEPAHVAVLDFLFYTGSQFPQEYRGGAFLAFHGSWNRSKRVGQSVAFVPFRNGRPSGGQESVVTGWMLSPEEKDVWGRPVGLLQMPDGSMLISDDGGGKIWHLTYKQ